ncbi:DUF4235 domain-containing protein [Propionibacterium sp.]|uniref:DUF4235 domain-containing protein n=1 Tax=Propionibacterium sp. TaxID=1977903 RepID=UPI0039EB5E1F
MALVKNMQFKILTAAASAAVGLIGRHLLTKSWRDVTGEEPPDPADPDVPVVKAVTWFFATTLVISLVQLLVQRGAAKKSMAKTGDLVDEPDYAAKPFTG